MTLTPLARLTGKLLPLLALAALIPLGRPSAAAQNYQFSTLAGLAGNSGSTDGTGTAARFYRPAGIAIDSAGNVYLADTNSTIRKVSPAGVVTTLAGTAGLTGSTDGTGSAASFNSPAGVGVDASGNLYVAEEKNHTIRKITPAGVVTTFAGLAGVTNSTDGVGSAARFNGPRGVAVDAAGNVYVGDRGNHTIRKITPAGAVTTLAGLAATPGSTDGTGSGARFNGPRGVAVDGAGNVYVADNSNHTIRKVTAGGVVTTLAGLAGSLGFTDGTGSAARFTSPFSVAVDAAGNVYVADTENSLIRRVTPDGVVTTLAGLAGLGNEGSSDGTGSAARFNRPRGLAADGAGGLYVADTENHTIRKGVPNTNTPPTITTQPLGQTVGVGSNVTFTVTATGTAPLAYQWRFNGTPIAGATNASYALFNVQTNQAGSYSVVVTNLAGSATSSPASLTAIPPAPLAQSYAFTTLAGLAGSFGSTDSTGSAARFSMPYDVATDAAGNVYVADGYNHTIRKVTPGGTVATLAGAAGFSGSTDGAGTTARFNYPGGVAVDGAGNVYVGDSNNGTVRKISPGGVVTTLAGLAGATGTNDGTGSAARFYRPNGLAVDGAGNLYVADTGNNTIRKVTPAGEVTTLAGMAGSAGSADGTGSAARFNTPVDLTVDGAGNVYVADTYNHTIRKVTPSGVVTTIAGLPGTSGGMDGTGSLARFGYPGGIATDWAGNLYVGDTENNTVRRVTYGGVVTTLGGLAGTIGSSDGSATAARFARLNGVAVDGAANLYVADTENHTIRKGVPNTNTPPTITTQPLGQTVGVGSNVTFTVTATGTAPLSYQWRKDGVPVPGATNAAYALANVQPPRIGDYSVIITNAAGSITSSIAPLNLSGVDPALWRGLVAYYPFNGNANDETGNGNNGVMTGGAIVTDRFGSPGRALDLNGQGEVVTVPHKESLNLTNDLTLSGWVRIQDPPAFRNNYTIFAKRSPASFNEYPYGFVVNYQFGIPSDYAQLMFTTAHSGSYQYLGSAGGIVPTNQWVHLAAVVEPNRVKLFLAGVQVADQPVTPGSRFGNEVPLLIGSGARTDVPAEFFKGQLDDLRIYNRALSSNEVASLYASEAAPPTITTQPLGQTVGVGSNVTFTVTATGTAPLAYQWRFNGTPIAGATNASYALFNVQTNQAGSYTVVVTNLAGSATSSPASLTVNQLSQTITFAAIPNKLTTDAPFMVSAGASSGLPVSFSVISGPATISSNIITLTGAGSVTVRATQLGDAVYLAAAAVDRSFTVLSAGTLQFTSATASVAENAGTVTLSVTRAGGSDGAVAVGYTTANGTATAGSDYTATSGTLSWPSGDFAAKTITVSILEDSVSESAETFTVALTNASGGATFGAVSFLTVSIADNDAVTGRVVRLPAVTVAAGAQLSIPVDLLAQGNENALGFSVSYDSALLNFVAVSNGPTAGAVLNVNTLQTNSSRVGVAVSLPAGQTFAAGTQEVARLVFQVASLSVGTNTTLAFGNAPVAREVSDATANSLAATYQDGVIAISVGFEADVTPRPNGNGTVSITDWVQVGRFAAGLDTVTNASELMRADCAPRSTLGNGSVTITDWVQAGRYAAGLDPLTPAGGPTALALPPLAPQGRLAPAAVSRVVRVLDTSVNAGNLVTVTIELAAQGDENALGFSLNFDASKLTYSSAAAGVGAVGATLNVNASQVGLGRLGIALALPAGQAIAAGNRALVAVTFSAASEASGLAALTFGNIPIPQEVSDSVANSLTATFTGGTVTINGGASGPVITVQPASAVVVPAGSSVLLSVTVSGTGLGYQWLKGALPLAGATAGSLSLTNVNRASAGNYLVVVTNAGGSVTSSVSLVRVLVPQRLLPPERLGDGRFRLRFGDFDGGLAGAGELGAFEVHASTDAGNWVRLTNGLSIVNGQVQIEDASAPGLQRRFYRIIER